MSTTMNKQCEHYYKTSSLCQNDVVYTYLEPNKTLTHVCKDHILYWNNVFSTKKYKLYVVGLNKKYSKIHEQL